MSKKTECFVFTIELVSNGYLLDTTERDGRNVYTEQESHRFVFSTLQECGDKIDEILTSNKSLKG